MTQRVKVKVFSPIRSSKSSFAKWSRNIEPLNTSVDKSATQESNSTSFCIDKIGVKSLPGEFVTDLDTSKRMDLESSDLGEIPKVIDFGLSSFNARGKPNSVFTPSTRAKRLDGAGGDSLNGDWLASSHVFERVSKMKAYSNNIKKSDLETRENSERENIQTENIPLTRQPDFVTPLPDSPKTRSTRI